ncbi:MAG: SRPBCC family protein [Bacteroidota bacterium]|nr:SRPBCC family protein [Bacteroidota bacterium]
MEINSSTATVDQSTEMLFSKLSQVDNYKQLMPEGAAFTTISDNQFRFKLGSLPEKVLSISEKKPNESIVLKSSNNKISFSQRVQLTEVSSDQTNIQLQFKGNFNPMMAMMVKKPLTQFMESLVSNMHKL